VRTEPRPLRADIVEEVAQLSGCRHYPRRMKHLRRSQADLDSEVWLRATLWAAGNTARSGRAAPCGQADRGARSPVRWTGLGGQIRGLWRVWRAWQVFRVPDRSRRGCGASLRPSCGLPVLPLPAAPGRLSLPAPRRCGATPRGLRGADMAGSGVCPGVVTVKSTASPLSSACIAGSWAIAARWQEPRRSPPRRRIASRPR
jgi:hypothetical protein